MVTPQWRHRGLGFTPSRVDQMRQSLGQSIWGNNNKDQYTGMAACLNCIWSNINHCHCVFIDIVLDTFLIILGSTPSIDGQMGQVIWDRPFRETMTRTNSEQLYSIECYVFSLTSYSFLIIRVHSFASRPNGPGSLSGVASLGIQ